MRFRFRQLTWQTAALVLAGLVAFAAPAAAKPGQGNKLWSSKASKHSGRSQWFDKLDRDMMSRSKRLLGTSKVILTINPGQEANAEKEIKKLGGRIGRRLSLVNGMAVELPNRVIKQISERSEVLSVHFDRPIAQHNNRTAVSVGARAAQQLWGYDGAGVGVAVIDSGIANWHDDLGLPGQQLQGASGRRAARDGLRRLRQRSPPGRTTTTATARTSRASSPATAMTPTARAPGIAPAAHLVSLKVLDEHGGGYISDVIAAFEWAVSEPRHAQHPRHQPVGGRSR